VQCASETLDFLELGQEGVQEFKELQEFRRNQGESDYLVGKRIRNA
jgi:hypothetical protein